MSIVDRIKTIICEENEKRWIKRLQNRNNNLNPTIICNNCIGGVIYHNLGLKFHSPTINLFISGEDYLNFVKDVKYYSACKMEQIESDKPWPVGQLISKEKAHKDIIVNFQHYNDFQSAYNKWTERFSRINYDNIYYIWEFYDDLYDISLIQEFDKLPIKK